MTIAYITHDDCLLHDMGQHHPERPARLDAINQRLSACGLDAVLQRFEAPPVARPLLEAAHSPAYIDQIEATAPVEGMHWVDADTGMNPHSLGAAQRAAGAAVLAVDLVLQAQCQQAFCAVRPPGHHAERERGMGFCLFNSIAVAALYALQQRGIERVAIVDFDVHHGNGTEDIVAGDERILFCSTFQHPLYPDTGLDCEAANVVNTPLSPGAGSTEFRAAVEQHWLPRLAGFAPDLVFISAGFDAHQADQLGGLNLLESDYSWVTQRLCEQARASAQGRIVSCLEGGYDLQALAHSVEAHLRALLEAAGRD